MQLMIIVLVVSFLLSVLLNKLAEKMGWKDKAMKYIDEKPQMRSLPMVLGVVGIIALLVMGKLGVDTFILVPIQVVIITIAVFLFELFREI